MRLHEHTTRTTARGDGQRCPVTEDRESGELKQRSAAFYAYNRDNYPLKVDLAIKNPTANSILEFLVSQMDNTNAVCISMATLEKIFGIKRNAISKHIKYLIDRDFIEIFKVGNMNAYAINAYLVWTQGDANLWKAKFTASLYLDFDEQTEKVKSKYTKRVETK